MKKVILLALLVTGLNSVAQQKIEKISRLEKEQMTPEQRQEQRLKRLTSELNLDTKQQQEVKSLIADQKEKVAEFKAKKEEIKAASPGEKKEMRAKMKEEKELNDAKMKAILTPEQYTKWDANRKARMQKAKEKRNNRK